MNANKANRSTELHLLQALEHLVVDGSSRRHVADRDVDQAGHRLAERVIEDADEDDQELVAPTIVTLVDHQRVRPLLAEGRNAVVEGGGDRILHDASRLRSPATKLRRQLRRLHTRHHHTFHQLGQMVRNSEGDIVFGEKKSKTRLQRRHHTDRVGPREKRCHLTGARDALRRLLVYGRCRVLFQIIRPT